MATRDQALIVQSFEITARVLNDRFKDVDATVVGVVPNWPGQDLANPVRLRIVSREEEKTVDGDRGIQTTRYLEIFGAADELGEESWSYASAAEYALATLAATVVDLNPGGN